MYLPNIAMYILWGIFFSCTNQRQNIKETKSEMTSSNYQKMNYDSSILLIERKLGTFTFSEQLLTIEEFKDLYEHSSFYINEAKNFLSKDNFTLQEKKITVYSMQNLDKSNYISFCVACKNLYDEGKIPELLLKTAINPNFLKKYPIIRNYNDADVISLLNGIKNEQKISPEFKELINEILSGKSWQGVKKFMEDSGQ